MRPMSSERLATDSSQSRFWAGIVSDAATDPAQMAESPQLTPVGSLAGSQLSRATAWRLANRSVIPAT